MTTAVKPGADLVATQNQHGRVFYQLGGARPTNPVYLSGVEGQHVALEGVSQPITGGITRFNVPDPRRPGQFQAVATQKEAPDFGSLTFRVLEAHGSIPFVLSDLLCPTTIYRATGKCARLDDLNGGWTSYVEILPDVQFTDNDGGTRSPAWDSDEAIENSLDGQITGSRYAVGQLFFGETASVQVEREVIDIIYGSAVQCGDCGIPNDGSKRIYALTKSSGSGSPGITTEIMYTVNGGATWADTTITGLAGTTDANAIDVVGNYLIVVVNASLGYYYTALDELGKPTGTWTLVTSGFVAAKAPNDIFVAGSGEVYFCGDGGYIYKSTDITTGVAVLNAGVATTQNLYRIHGDGQDTIVAGGAAGALIISRNRGVSFATPTVNPTADRISAISVLDSRRYWVGNTLGQAFYTLSAGLEWTQVTIPSSTGIDDILFVTSEVGYILYRNTTPAARLYATFTGGERWTSSLARIGGTFPTFAHGNRLATPGTASHPTVASNNIAIGGLSAALGNDGVIYIGAAPIR